MEDGAILEGNCSMVESKENLEQRAAEQKQQFSTNKTSSYAVSDSSTDDEIEDAELYDDLDNSVNESEDEDMQETADAAAN